MLLRRGVLGKFTQDRQCFGDLIVLFVEAGQFQQTIAIARVDLRRLTEVRRRVAEFFLAYQRVGETQLGAGRFGIDRKRRAKVLFRLHHVSGCQLALGEVVARSEILRLLARSVLEQRQCLGGIFLAKQQQPSIGFGFEEPGLQFKGLAVFGDACGVLVQKSVSDAQD